MSAKDYHEDAIQSNKPALNELITHSEHLAKKLYDEGNLTLHESDYQQLLIAIRLATHTSLDAINEYLHMNEKQRYLFDQSIVKIRPHISEEEREQFEKAFNEFNTPVLLHFINIYLPGGINENDIKTNAIKTSHKLPANSNDQTNTQQTDDNHLQQNIYQFKSMLHRDFKRLFEIKTVCNQPAYHYFHQLIIELTSNENPNPTKVNKLIDACIIIKYSNEPIAIWIKEFTLLIKEKINFETDDFKRSITEKLKQFPPSIDETKNNQ